MYVPIHSSIEENAHLRKWILSKIYEEIIQIFSQIVSLNWAFILLIVKISSI